MNKNTHFIATVREYGDIEQVAASLREQGCTVTNVMPIIGMIVGSSTKDLRYLQEVVDGLESLSVDKSVRAI